MAYFPYESAIWAKLTGEGSYLIGMTSAGTGHLRPETLLLRWITYMASKLVLPIGWELSWGYLSGASVPLHVSLFKRRLEKKKKRDFPGGAVVKNLPANAGDTGSIPGPGRSHMPRSN